MAVMAGSMALAQTHKHRDNDRDTIQSKKTVTKIHNRSGLKTVTIVKKQKGDKDHDKDEVKRTVTKRTVWTRHSHPNRQVEVEKYHKRVPGESNAVFQRRLRHYRASWHHRKGARKTVIVTRKVVHANRGRHRGWWIGKGNRRHHTTHHKSWYSAVKHRK